VVRGRHARVRRRHVRRCRDPRQPHADAGGIHRALPAVAIVPFFFAGSFFPISALPAGLTVIGKLLPITHVLALVRYGLVDRDGNGLHDIWGMSNTTAITALSLGVVALFALVLTAVAMRTFRRTAVR
jgi:ABC-type polysaccharide/polyol phosphate export permease